MPPWDDRPVVRAVILAAGASTRIGRPKAALSITDRADTFLSRLIRSLLAAGLPDIVIVTGAAPDEVRHAALPFSRRVRFVHNAAWQRGQLSSLLVGLDAAPITNLEAILMTLVDVPLVTADTVRTVVHAWRRTRGPIVRPARGDEHGHPVICDRAVFDELRAADPAVGAKAVVRAHAHEIVNVGIDDPGAYFDVDTADDYERLKAIAADGWKARGEPPPLLARGGA
jgi:CTP:molybdopterin cytidylyltransferase MocA